MEEQAQRPIYICPPLHRRNEDLVKTLTIGSNTLSQCYFVIQPFMPNPFLSNHTPVNQPTHSFPPLITTLSILTPSSACSSTSKLGNTLGMILRGLLPGTTLYLSKSASWYPHSLRR